MSNSSSRNVFVTPAPSVRQRRPRESLALTNPPRPFKSPPGVTPSSCRDAKDVDSDMLEVKKAYDKYLKGLLSEILVDDATEREVTEVDWKMAELVKRFEMNKILLEKTNRRLKDISFQAEHQRLMDLRDTDVSSFLTQLDRDDPNLDMATLLDRQKAYLNRIRLENATIGQQSKDGCKELHDTLVDTIAAFEDIKKISKLTDEEFEKYHKMGETLGKGMDTGDDMDDMRKEVESMLPSINEKVLREASKSLQRFRMISEEAGGEEETPVHDYD